MTTVAKLKNARIAAQKVRLVADQVRGLKVEKAHEISVSYTTMSLPPNE